MALGKDSIAQLRVVAEDISYRRASTATDIDELMSIITNCEDYEKFKTSTFRGQDIHDAMNTLIGLLKETLLPLCSKMVSDLQVFADRQERINQ